MAADFGVRLLRPIVLVALLSMSAACDVVLGPTKPDSNWRPHDSARFTLFVRPGSFAEQSAARLAEVLEDQYSVTVAALDLRYSGRVAGFLHNSAADADLGSDYAGVGYPDNETFRAVCVPPLGGNLFGLLSHEANHVILQNGLGRPGTSFVNEGLASAVLSERFDAFGKSFLYAWTKTHASQLPPLAGLADDAKWTDYPQDVAYKTSASFLAYLLDTSGVSRLRQLYYAPSSDFSRRFQEIYGRSLEDAERAWKEFCAGQPG
jgi:hypothetical protein